MRVIMTGGGTGGHIYPAISIADKIKENDKDAEILFVGTMNGMENDIVPQNGYPIKPIHASGFNRRNMLKNVKTGVDLVKGSAEASRIIKKFKPDMVIGTGGYVCVPMIRAAHKAHVRCFIHEQNAFPGMANRTLEKYVDKVFLGFAEGAEYFKEPDKHVTVGNPIRAGFLSITPAKARRELGIASDAFVVLSFGGSLGAGRINKTMIAVSETFSGKSGTQVFFGTGRMYYDAVMEELKDKGITLGNNIHITEYINDMDKYIMAADLIISRAGALTIAELTACGKPAVLVPSPNVTGNHQYFNAKAVADKGGAILIEEKDLTDDSLIAEIFKLKNDAGLLGEMGRNSRRCAFSKASQLIYDEIIK